MPLVQVKLIADEVMKRESERTKQMAIGVTLGVGAAFSKDPQAAFKSWLKTD